MTTPHPDRGWAARAPHAAALALTAALSLALPAQSQPLGARGDDFLYQVVPHDTLEQLARRYTLQPANWPALQTLNQVDDPYRLPIGKVLRIPMRLIPKQAAQARVTYVSGAVSNQGKPLRQGDTLHAGQTLTSGPGGSATLALEDGSLITLAPGSELHLATLRTFQGSGLSDTILTLPKGDLESSVAPRKTGVGRFEVRTPATVTGVRGTRLRVHADPAGSRHEVVTGQAAIQDAAHAEQTLPDGQGAAYDRAGTLLAQEPLLPAPRLPAPTAAAAHQPLGFAPVPKAQAYRIQIALDAEGSQVESSTRSTQPVIHLEARGPGRRYVRVRAIDALGIEGEDATLTLESPGGLLSGDGRPVRSGDGLPVRLRP